MSLVIAGLPLARLVRKTGIEPFHVFVVVAMFSCRSSSASDLVCFLSHLEAPAAIRGMQVLADQVADGQLEWSGRGRRK